MKMPYIRPTARSGPILFFCILILFFHIPSFSAESVSPRHGGHLVQSTTSDPKSFNDIIAKETSTTLVTSQIFEGLTTPSPYDGTAQPHLAERWEISEDGLRFTFFLRDDVFWHDGERFTSDDVVFTFNDLIFNKEIPSSSRDILTIDGQLPVVEKVDDFTVRFTLPVPFAPFLRSMGQAILPEHILREAVSDGDFNFTWGIDTDPRDVIGTGPFRFTRYDPGQRLVFERFDQYWKRDNAGNRLPYLERITFLIVQNADVELLKFLEGTLDVYGMRGMDFPLLKPLEEEKNFTVYELGAARGSSFLAFNQNPRRHPETGEPFVDPVKLSWFTDRNFRRAVAHGIDKEKMIEIVMNNIGFPQYSPIGPGAGFFHNPDVTEYPFDLEKAKRILAEAGYKDINGDGYLQDSSGNRIEFVLNTNTGSTERLDIANIIRSDLQKLGIKINFKPLEFNTLVSKLLSSWDWEGVILGFTGGTEPHFGQNVWSTEGNLHMWNPRQEKPATDWEKRINEIFTEGVQILDDTRRKPLYDEFQQIVSDELPFIYTVLSARLVAVRNRFGNLEPTNLGGVFHNIEQIYVIKEAE